MKKKTNKTPLGSIIEKINDRYTFSYSAADYDYDTHYACKNGSDCCDNDYCRCGIIQNACVTKVNTDYIVKTLTEDVKDDIFLPYCIDRIIRTSKILDLSSWEVDVGGGYYGEEVNGVRLDASVINDLITSLTELENLSPVDKVKKLLEREYGYVLPRLEKLSDAKVVEVDLDSIKLFNDEYLRKISKDTVDFYKDYNLPRGVCVKAGKLYSVVDGYHRMLSAQKNKLKTIKIIELV